MKRTLLLAAAALMVVSANGPALATETGCAVVLKTPDGFLNLRQGPGTRFQVVAKLNRGDFIYVGTEQCYAGRCTDERHSWTHVEGFPRLNKHGDVGWVNDAFIQWSDCPENYQEAQ